MNELLQKQLKSFGKNWKFLVCFSTRANLETDWETDSVKVAEHSFAGGQR